MPIFLCVIIKSTITLIKRSIMGEFMNMPSGEENGVPNQESNETKESLIDFEMYERSLKDGTADEYREEVGALPAEALLEEQGDERVWPELSKQEQEKIKALLSEYAESNGLELEVDEDSCMVM